MGHEALVELQDVLHLHEAHLQVQLGEVGLAVGAEVLVPEAAGDLEVAVQPRHHQHLLEELGGLGQGVEEAGLVAVGHQEVPGPFRGAFGEKGVSTWTKPSRSRKSQMALMTRWRRRRFSCMRRLLRSR